VRYPALFGLGPCLDTAEATVAKITDPVGQPFDVLLDRRQRGSAQRDDTDNPHPDRHAVSSPSAESSGAFRLGVVTVAFEHKVDDALVSISGVTSK
jgi:hypothetical protein